MISLKLQFFFIITAVPFLSIDCDHRELLLGYLHHPDSSTHDVCGLWFQHTEYDLPAAVILGERNKIHGGGEMEHTTF